MKTKVFFYLIASALLIASCKNDDSPGPTETELLSGKTADGGLTGKAYEQFIKNKLRSSRTMTYTEHGPFNTPSSGNVEIPGPDGNAKVWKEALSGFPGYVPGIYFCRYYEHSYTLTLPANQWLVPNSVSAANNGYMGAAPPNPVGPATQTGASFTYYPALNQYKFVTYTLLPVYDAGGNFVNTGGVRLPTNFSTTTFNYKYYTL